MNCSCERIGLMERMQQTSEMERDLRMLQSMYPNSAKRILPAISEMCDRLEYEGSLLFDERPDYETVLRMVDRLERELVNSTQSPCLRDMIRMVLLHEIQFRRLRYRELTSD